LTAIDILSVTGLLNHFGKTRDVEDIRMAPVLLRKGRTHLSMYGLGAIRDERLHRAFVQEQVRLFRPLDGDTEEGFEGWFNLCLLHQNRAAHGLTNHIPEHFIDGCMDLIIWGHEHECRIVPEWNAQRDFYVSQPGSSVATSLSEGEAKSK
jgi:double-strand break repair protein MRE11